MAKKVLVVYATKSGSTREVAEFMVKVLKEKGVEADLNEMKKVKSVKEYDAFVLGAPMYMFRIIGDAHSFLKKFRKFIEKTPSAFFSLGPIEDKEEDWKNIRGNFDKELAKYPWFQPVEKEVFGGRFEVSRLVFPYTLIPAKDQLPQGDLRDWNKIRSWAESLPVKFSL
jgi:menaquinone-dependent protoporphyrinogen oxidase